MTNVGETLRRERLRRGMDLQEVAREIKIRPKLLEYIEADQFDRLPGGVFAKSFVKQYASLLGLDGDEFAAEVHRQIQPAPPAHHNITPVTVDVPMPSRAPAWETLGGRKSSSAIPSLILVVVVVVACSFAYNWWASSSVGHPEPRHTATRSEPAAPPAPHPRQETAKPAEAPPPQPAPPAAVDPGVPVQVTLTATEDTWVSAHADGKQVFSTTLAANESRTVQGLNGVRLVVGNAGGITVTLNGKPVGPIGPHGQVRVVQLTPSGAQIQTKTPADERPRVAIPDVL
jgi:cytoskeleton protein RodZ